VVGGVAQPLNKISMLVKVMVRVAGREAVVQISMETGAGHLPPAPQNRSENEVEVILEWTLIMEALVVEEEARLR